MIRPRAAVGSAAFLAIAAIALGVGVASWALDLFTPLDRAIQDAQTRALTHQIASDIVIVEIDARSLYELSSWPWPRRYHAKMIDELLARRARRVFMDVDFSSHSNPTDDAALSRAVGAAGERLVLPMFWRPTSVGSTTLMRSEPLPALRKTATLGLVNLIPDKSGVVREIRAFDGGETDTAPPVAYVLAAQKSPRSGTTFIDFRISPSSFQTVSFVDVLQGRSNVPDLQDKIVFVGATSSELNDMIPVPVYDTLPGVLVQALALESVRGDRVLELPAPGFVCLLILWTVVGTLIMRSVPWSRAPVMAAAFAAGTLILSVLLHAEANVLLKPSPLLVTLVAALLGTLLASLRTESWAAWSNWRQFKRQDALLAEIVTHSADGIITLDAQGKVRTANPAASTLLRMSPQELRSTSIERLLPQGRALINNPVHGRAGATEVTLEDPEGRRTPVEVVVGRIQVSDESVIAVTLRDITAQKDRERELRFHATHDGLTGLPNRIYLAERLGEVLAPEGADGSWALVLLDLDGFKEINDTLGHSVGDVVLVELARRLSAQVPRGTCIARLGGDEFAILLQVSSDRAEIASRCSELLMVAADPVLAKGIPVHLGISAGVACYPVHAHTAETLLQRADIALYAAKRNRSNLEFYDPSIDHSSPRRLEMLSLLRTAIAQDEISLHYQPKVSLTNGEVRGVEALARWTSPVLGTVSPAEFIALAEATDLITPLTHLTLRRALQDCCAWRAQGMDLQVAVNLSARHLQDARLPHVVEEMIHASGAEPTWLELEITESAIMADPDRAFRIVQALREIGVAISIDDFGTGYSSLAYLQNLNIDRLKIDRSFVTGMTEHKGSRVIVASIVQLGHALGLDIVAEGIETLAQRDQLRSLGCDLGQGYLFAAAMKNEAMLQWCAGQSRIASSAASQESFFKGVVKASAR